MAITDLGNLAMLYDGKNEQRDVCENMRNRLRKFERPSPLALVAGLPTAASHTNPVASTNPNNFSSKPCWLLGCRCPLEPTYQLYNAGIDDTGRRKLALQGALTQAIQ